MKFLKILFNVFIISILLFFLSVKRIERKELETTPHFKLWKKQIELFKPNFDSSAFEVGYAKSNITPAMPTPLAGYGSRLGKAYKSVHDSVFVRAISIKANNKLRFFVSADLLIIAPNVTEKLATLLKKDGIKMSDVHLAATHTHNSVGSWGNSITGRAFAGAYDPEMVVFLSQKIFETIKKSEENFEPALPFYGEIRDTVDIRNRLLINDGWTDPELRQMGFELKSGKKVKLITYGAHSTVLNSKTLELSRDYPGVLIDSVEKTQDFGMFMAGAVASQGPYEIGNDDFDEVLNQGNGVFSFAKKIPQLRINPKVLSELLFLPLPEPSARITKNLGLRPWLFKILYGDYPSNVKITMIDNTLVIGLPCDFSGEIMAELDQYATKQGINLVVTSFNGSYAGYVTHDRLYDLDLYETTIMSWFGYQNGKYFSTVVKDIIDKLKKRPN